MNLTLELFSSPDLPVFLAEASADQLNEAAFGVVKMDSEGRVVTYNAFESVLSGLSPGRVIGKHFFTEVAPCTNNFMVAQRFLDAEALDETVDYVFTFRMKPTRVRLRLLKSAEAPFQYLVVERL